MEKLKNIVEQYGRWMRLKEYIIRIESSILSDFSLALENAKALLESISKEICKSKDVEISASSNINNVLRTAFLAIGYNSSNHVTKISSALATIGQQMGNLRNEIGITSHGKLLDEIETRNDKIDEITKEFIIDSTEMIASFLIICFENKNPRITTGISGQKILLNDNIDFNDFWDEGYGEFSMGNYSYTASEILFYTDNEAYLTELKAFKEGEE